MAMTFASRYRVREVVLGITVATAVVHLAPVGMVAADGLAIGVGSLPATRLPEKAVAYGAAALFALFGVVLVLEGFGLVG